jgi:hypothetical protein
MLRSATAVLLVHTLLGGITVAADFRARPFEATLTNDDRAYPRVGVKPNWYPTHQAGGRRYRVDANIVTDVTAEDESTHRRANVPEEYRLCWCGAAEGVAFLIANLDPVKLDPVAPESARRLHRLDLDAMKWLDPFVLPEPSIEKARGVIYGSGEPQQYLLAEHLIVTPRGIVVLCEEMVENRSGLDYEIRPYDSVGFHVCCYAPTDVEAKWTRALRHDNRAHHSVGYAMRSYDDSIQQLAFVPGSHGDDLILVCPGERDAIVCLTAVDGKVCWRVPAMWEYERGFIGPSVFEYYIERFGLDYLTVHAAERPVPRGSEDDIDRKELRESIQRKLKASRKLAAARKAFYARYQGRITAGPIVVPDAGRGGRPVVYVAAVRSLKPDPGSVEQPEHAFVYEIDPRWDRVEINAMTRLPRSVVGRPLQSVPGGLVLSCDRGCMVRLRTYQPVFGGLMGPGRMANDLVLQIDWYREYLMPSPSAWFTARPRSGVADFSEARLFRPSVAYIRQMGDKVFHLRINVVDLRIGLDHDLALSVPFEGNLPMPDRELGSVNAGHASERLSTSGPHAVWIDRLIINNDRLTTVVAHGSERTAVTFDLSAMLADER